MVIDTELLGAVANAAIARERYKANISSSFEAKGKKARDEARKKTDELSQELTDAQLNVGKVLMRRCLVPDGFSSI